ncbi:uncharacterized protein LOC114339064 isoform X2 [Diabrotica virgifera virgifera]|uniref:Uncharacterized protein n=1 Tax=Diabrotica virgifera virgifera TaxID=50390 RepID=A0ABM5KEB5_DIAVI|nr:uncharacterized protein LOC114339064 isoform X2 [Diabrotica virgifera virgifera]
MRNIHVLCIVGVIFNSISSNGILGQGISFGDLKDLFVAVDKIVENPDDFFDKVKQELQKENVTLRSLNFPEIPEFPQIPDIPKNFPEIPDIPENYPNTPQLRFLGIGSMFNKVKNTVTGIFGGATGALDLPVKVIEKVVARILIILFGPKTKANIPGLAHTIAYVINFILKFFF